MKMQEVLGRADMSVEKGRALDAVFATWTVDKKAKRLSSKMKAYLANKVTRVWRISKLTGCVSDGIT